ncbi:MAG: hypothetical protein ACYTGF_07770 [Planctomycetota bacterium]|jgi:hypothetical protein
MKMQTTIAAMTIVAASGPAWAGYAITQGPTAPTYTGKTLNFDEPGGPTGFVTTDAWLASHGLTIDAGDGVPQVDDWATITGQPWLGNVNSFYGNFGVFMTFESDLSAMSLEVWDPSGPPGPFGGGLAVYMFDNGVEVASSFVTPAWGGIGDTWFDITADGGDVFDEVRILGWGFTPTTYADNMSWDVVPGPGSLALLAVAGLVSRRRRRA